MGGLTASSPPDPIEVLLALFLGFVSESTCKDSLAYGSRILR